MSNRLGTRPSVPHAQAFSPGNQCLSNFRCTRASVGRGQCSSDSVIPGEARRSALVTSPRVLLLAPETRSEEQGPSVQDETALKQSHCHFIIRIGSRINIVMRPVIKTLSGSPAVRRRAPSVRCGFQSQLLWMRFLSVGS